MRRTAAMMTTLVALGWATAAGAAAAPKLGQPAPNFTVTTYGGRTVRLADLKGDVVVLNFWATWCGPRRAELPLLESFFRATSQYGVQVLAVATEDSVSERDLRKVAARLTIPFVKTMKGPYRTLGAVPTNYIIDRHGNLAYAKADAFDVAKLNAILVPLLREPIPKDAPDAAPVTETQPGSAAPTTPSP